MSDFQIPPTYAAIENTNTNWLKWFVDVARRLGYPQIPNNAPVNATAPGIQGEVRFDSNFIYVCTATNTWKRASLSTW